MLFFVNSCDKYLNTNAPLEAETIILLCLHNDKMYWILKDILIVWLSNNVNQSNAKDVCRTETSLDVTLELWVLRNLIIHKRKKIYRALYSV